MLDDFRDFRREPSISHQCTYHDDVDGRRCRARAMRNQYRCFAHRSEAVPPVYENEPFDILDLTSRDAIQQALADVAGRLACNRIDLKRAGLLVYALQLAASNLAAHPHPAPEPSVTSATTEPSPPVL